MQPNDNDSRIPIAYTNIVLAIPHAVGKPCDDFDWSSDATTAAYRNFWTDWETDRLFSVPMENVTVVSCPMSRIDVDVERLEGESDRICNFTSLLGGLNPCYYRESISYSWWNRRLAMWFKYRADLMLAAAKGECPMILDCHSFPSKLAADVDVCLGFNSDYTKPSDNTINAVTMMFKDAGYRVAYNCPYGNAIAPVDYHGHSLMIEVNKQCYLDSEERRIGDGFAKLHQTLAATYNLILSLPFNQ